MSAKPILKKLSVLGAFLALACLSVSASAQDKPQTSPGARTAETLPEDVKTAVATFGGGCFWCVEAVFENVHGVTDVVSGYEGGRTPNPNYKQICSGYTGHAEVCQITYNPQQVSFTELLEIFWKTHDPTTLNQQGPDRGTQYRSVVFYHNEEQKELAEKYRKKLDDAGAFNSKIVTEITRTRKFYTAEEYHQDYYRLNPDAGYCANIVRPKVEKFKKAFADKVESPK